VSELGCLGAALSKSYYLPRGSSGGYVVWVVLLHICGLVLRLRVGCDVVIGLVERVTGPGGIVRSGRTLNRLCLRAGLGGRF
jgi:hypothetical protein